MEKLIGLLVLVSLMVGCTGQSTGAFYDDSDTESDIDTDTGADADTDTDSDSDVDTDSDADSDSDSDTATAVDTVSDSDTGSDTVVDSGTDTSDTDTGSVTDTDTVDTDTGSIIDTESDTGVDTGIDTGVDTGIDTVDTETVDTEPVDPCPGGIDGGTSLGMAQCIYAVNTNSAYSCSMFCAEKGRTCGSIPTSTTACKRMVNELGYPYTGSVSITYGGWGVGCLFRLFNGSVSSVNVSDNGGFSCDHASTGISVCPCLI